MAHTPPARSPGETCTHIHVCTPHLIPPHTYTPTKACTHEDTPQARPQQLSSWWGHLHGCVSVCACVCVCALVGRCAAAHEVSAVSSASLPRRKQEEEEGKKPSGPLSEAGRGQE